MAYEIIIKSKANRLLKKLDTDLREKLSEIIDGLAENPRPANSTNFKSIEKGYRIKEADYRIVYQVFDSKQLIKVLIIGDRKETYKKKYR